MAKKSDTINVGGISEEPMDRVHPKLKKVLNDQNQNPSFDTHCHFFNFECVPEKYIFLKLPTHYQSDHNVIEKLEDILHNLRKDRDTDFADNLAYFLDFGNQKSIKEVAEKLFSYYPDNTIFTPLMMDLQWGFDSKPPTPYNKQIQDMKDLRNNVFPEKILPFIALDPNNPDVFKIFSNALSNDGGFFGVKIYPALGYLPSDEKLMKIFEVCEEKNIPVTTHCGGNIIHSTKRFIKVKGKEINSKNELVDREVHIPHLIRFAGKKIGEVFNDPKNWEPVLSYFPNLKLNFGHFGGSNEWENMLKGKESRVSRIIDFMMRYDYVYADFSYNISNRKLYDGFRRLLEANELIRNRTLYGSDYYMVTAAGNFRLMRADFVSAMGDEIMNRISKRNPRSFLFGEVLPNLSLFPESSGKYKC